MKNSIYSKNSNVRTEQELEYHFKELLGEDPDLQWRDYQNSERGEAWGARVFLELDGRVVEYVIEYILKPSIPQLKNLHGNNKIKTLLIAPNLTDRILSYCRDNKLSCIDLNGRAWLRAKGLLIDRKALPDRSFHYDQEPRNIFVGKSERLIRSVLSDRDKVWTQAELVELTQASSGMVSRLVQYLVNLSYLEKLNAREYRLQDLEGLLDEWCKSDKFSERNQTTFYSGSLVGITKVAPALQKWAVKAGVNIAFTQWIAAYQRCPYTEPAICSAYVERLPDKATLESIGLRQVPEGGTVWIHLPKDEGVFFETQSIRKLTLASDAQIYIDLKNTGLRGPDAAHALREWKGFCRK